MLQKTDWITIGIVSLVAILLALNYTITDKTYFCSSRGIVIECSRFSVSGNRCYPNLLDNKGYRDCSEGWIKLIDHVEEPSKTISPVREAYNGNYKVLRNTGFFDVTFAKQGKNTLICMEAEFDEKVIEIYDDSLTPEVIGDYTYRVPDTLPFFKSESLVKQSDLIKTKDNQLSATSPSNPNRFCYLANPDEDFYLKFGDFSVTVIQGKDISGNIILDNTLLETGAENFTHLKISTTAPYDRLIGYWPFDGDLVDTGTTTHYDLTGNNDGTGAGGGFVNSSNCKFDDCFQSDGTGDYIDLGTPSSLNPDYMSISAWVRTSATGSIDQIYTKDSTVVETERSWQFRKDDSEKLNYIVFTADATLAAVTSTTSISDGAWHHVAGTFDGSMVTVYVDGVNESDDTLSGVIQKQSNEIFIGFSETSTPGSWEGEIDEVMVFNSSLTQAQITDIYNNQSARFATRGTANIINISITSNSDRMNVTVEAETNFGSNISLSLGYYNGSWYSAPAQNLTKLSSTEYRGSFSVGVSTKTNWTLNFTHYAGNSSHPFYTSILKLNTISMENWSSEVVVDTSAPTFSSFEDNASSDTTNSTVVQLNVTITDATNVDFYTLSHNDSLILLYQENATESNNFSSPVMDGDTTTGNGDGVAFSNIFMNYSKPSDATGALWKLATSEGIVNYTVPSSCWDYDSTKIVLKVNMSDSSQYYFNCYNNTDWKLVLYNSEITVQVFEEAIWWNISEWINETIIDVEATTVNVIWNYSIKNFPITGGTMGWQVWANDTGGYSGVSAMQTVTVYALDSCTCPASGDWIIDCSDDCIISSNCDVGTNDIIINGASGTFAVLANITSDSFAYEPGCIIDNVPNDNKELAIG